NWSYHNRVINCSDVYFVLTPGSYSTADLQITASDFEYAPNPGFAAVTTRTDYSGLFLFKATIKYYFGAHDALGNAWDRFGDVQNARICVKKFMLHEVGHTMGLDDISPNTFGQTVMNGWSGTNETGNSMPTSVRPCDDSTVNDLSLYG